MAVRITVIPCQQVFVQPWQIGRQQWSDRSLLLVKQKTFTPKTVEVCMR